MAYAGDNCKDWLQIEIELMQARIHTLSFHSFTEIGQTFHKKKICIIFLIKVNCKLNLENSFDIYF